MPGGRGFGRGQGRGRRCGQDIMRGNRGMGGECICPGCGTTSVHEPGVPCQQVKCPKCGQAMARK